MRFSACLCIVSAGTNLCKARVTTEGWMNAGLTDSRRRSHVVVSVAIATLCVACHACSPPAGERGDALIIAQRQEPVSLNPLYLEGRSPPQSTS